VTSPAVRPLHHLSPLRKNQCRSHRSGRACDNCEEGWTLLFDSAECERVEKCTAGQTVLVLTVLYWIAIVVAVFVMMYFKVSIRYLYALSYYYSVIDNILGQIVYHVQYLATTVSTISSIAKVTPQFLGKLCLTKYIGGIDQQFLHYMHPIAVTFILIAISFLAKMSYISFLHSSAGELFMSFVFCCYYRTHRWQVPHFY